MSEMPRRCSAPDPQPGRRAVLKLAVGVGLALPVAGLVGAQDDNPRKARPQRNDRFVFAGGERKGQLITLADLPAWPRVSALVQHRAQEAVEAEPGMPE